MNLRIWKSVGPITLSALSLLLTFIFLEPIAIALDPTLHLLANRGAGKIIFTCMALYQILLFLCIQHKNFLRHFFSQSVSFFKTTCWLKTFFIYFIIFFFLHSATLALFAYAGYAHYSPDWGKISFSLLHKTLFGLVATFFLAWTEEMIFRGMIFSYFAQWYSTFASILITSTLFMFVHNLTNPFALISTDWKLGLGLFLLGLLLNQIYVITKKLYANMGVHAGLVFVKVVLRRAPFLVFVPEIEWAWWVHKDLRQSPLIHLFFLIAIITIFLAFRSTFFKPSEK